MQQQQIISSPTSSGGDDLDGMEVNQIDQQQQLMQSPKPYEYESLAHQSQAQEEASTYSPQVQSSHTDSNYYNYGMEGEDESSPGGLIGDSLPFQASLIANAAAVAAASQASSQVTTAASHFHSMADVAFTTQRQSLSDPNTFSAGASDSLFEAMLQQQGADDSEDDF